MNNNYFSWIGLININDLKIFEMKEKIFSMISEYCDNRAILPRNGDTVSVSYNKGLIHENKIFIFY